MKDVVDDVRAWTARGDRVALATVVGVRRSAPRPPGAKMAVNEHGEVSGAVSGGCVEGAVVEVAGEVLKGDGPRLLHFGIADSEAWDVGLPCGGEIDVYVEEYAGQGVGRSRISPASRAMTAGPRSSPSSPPRGARGRWGRSCSCAPTARRTAPWAIPSWMSARAPRPRS